MDARLSTWLGNRLAGLRRRRLRRLAPHKAHDGTSRNRVRVLPLLIGRRRRLDGLDVRSWRFVVLLRPLFRDVRALVPVAAVARLDDVCFQADGAAPAVKFQEQAARVAHYGAIFVAAPQRRRCCQAVLAHGDARLDLDLASWARPPPEQEVILGRRLLLLLLLLLRCGGALREPVRDIVDKPVARRGPVRSFGTGLSRAVSARRAGFRGRRRAWHDIGQCWCGRRAPRRGWSAAGARTRLAFDADKGLRGFVLGGGLSGLGGGRRSRLDSRISRSLLRHGRTWRPVLGRDSLRCGGRRRLCGLAGRRLLRRWLWRLCGLMVGLRRLHGLRTR